MATIKRANYYRVGDVLVVEGEVDWGMPPPLGHPFYSRIVVSILRGGRVLVVRTGPPEEKFREVFPLVRIGDPIGTVARVELRATPWNKLEDWVEVPYGYKPPWKPPAWLAPLIAGTALIAGTGVAIHYLKKAGILEGVERALRPVARKVREKVIGV